MRTGGFDAVLTEDGNTFRPWPPSQAGRVQATLVPYFARGNRRPGQTMRVRIPERMVDEPAAPADTWLLALTE